MHWCVAPSFSLSAAALLLIFAQWDKNGYSGIVVDPYSVPGASKSFTGRLMTDTCRMNSIDNGLLLCLEHHSDFDNHLFSIHPDVGIYMLFSFVRSNCVYPDACYHFLPFSHSVS